MRQKKPSQRVHSKETRQDKTRHPFASTKVVSQYKVTLFLQVCTKLQVILNKMCKVARLTRHKWDGMGQGGGVDGDVQLLLRIGLPAACLISLLLIDN